MFNRRESFIGIYNHTLSKQECNRCIELFESEPQRSGSLYKGSTLTKNTSLKKTIELHDTHFGNDKEYTHIILKGLSYSISQYFKKYQLPLSSIEKWGFDPYYNLQKYVDSDDGFKIWHTEQASLSTSNRMLAWMIYLNDAKSGTDFLYYPRVKARAGRCVIWPATWTHMHKSQPNKGVKYLATGWLRFMS